MQSFERIWRSSCFADEAVVLSPDAVKIKQLEEVTYDQIATAFNRKELFILIQLNLKRIYSIRI
jgi:hypothetical protein